MRMRAPRNWGGASPVDCLSLSYPLYFLCTSSNNTFYIFGRKCLLTLCRKRPIVTGVISQWWRASRPSLLHHYCLEHKGDGHLCQSKVTGISRQPSPFLVTRPPVWGIRPSPLCTPSDGPLTKPVTYKYVEGDGLQFSTITFFGDQATYGVYDYHLCPIYVTVSWRRPSPRILDKWRVVL